VKTLKRVSITAPEYMEIPCWTHADSLLADVGAKLEELRLDIPMMRYQQQDEVELTIRVSMPFMNAKGVLGISFSSRSAYLCPEDPKSSHSGSNCSFLDSYPFY
jgi:hypothetical protein